MGVRYTKCSHRPPARNHEFVGALRAALGAGQQHADERSVSVHRVSEASGGG